jgi:acyl-CoA dehydrogenase
MAGPIRCPVDLTDSQALVRDNVREICADFDDDYWRERDREATYPTEFVDALAEHGWMGVLIPEAYGGAGMGTEETVVMMEEIAASGGGFAASQSVHGGVYNSVPIVEYADEAMKEDLLPAVAAGETSIQAFGLTEPNAGSDSTSIETFAERDGDEYVINGGKIWTSRIDHSDYLLLVARTTPREEVEKRTRGISMFLVDVESARERGELEMEMIPKTASNAVHAFQIWFDDMRVPARHLVGEEGEGFYQVLDGLNEERLVIAAECIGLGEAALGRGVEYARQREVFDRQIGKNQAIQHPLAEAYMHLQAAKQLTYDAASRAGDAPREQVGVLANTAKYLAAEAAFDAADAAVQTHGGFGVAREYDVERFFREARLTRLVPITQQLALNYVAETELNLPRSY